MSRFDTTRWHTASFRGGHLDIDLGAIEANWRHLCALHAPGEVGAVLKADAYGMGAEAVAARLHAAGCRTFFTATASEAAALRPLVGRATVMALHGLAGGSVEQFRQPGEAPLPVLNSLDDALRWAALSRASGRRPAALHVDTGMARLGMPLEQFAALRAQADLLQALDLRFVLSHLASADDPLDPLNALQLRRFKAVCAELPGVASSLANSAGIFLGPAFSTDLARPGLALFGVHPGRRATSMAMGGLRPAVRLRARVVQLRDIGPGDSVGYNATWEATRPTRIATACIGYADGWPRSLSNRAAARFDGRSLPLVGRVSMDLSTFDATEAGTLAVGDWLDLIGPDRPAELVAEAAGTSPYEVLTALGQRTGRTYIDHASPA